MKILIVSDTHGRLENLERVIEMTKPIDALIHLGDVEGQEDYMKTEQEIKIQTKTSISKQTIEKKDVRDI